MASRGKLGAVMVLLAGMAIAAAQATVKHDEGLEEARRAYEASDYAKAIEVLEEASARDPKNGDIQLLLAKSYLELQQHDAAIRSAEKAVALDPRNSVFHEWLGRAYGDKADRAGWFSAISLAKKTRKEFQMAVELDDRNFSARQALIEFDCSAPGLVGGGEEKARPHIQKLMELNAAEGYYAAGNCRRQKKDFVAADEEFTRSLESRPRSVELIYDIGDYAMKREQPHRLFSVAEAGESVAPNDPRAKFYRGVALALSREKPEDAELLLRAYLTRAPKRNGYPSPAWVHAWLGRLYENHDNMAEARKELESALRLDPRNKIAQEELKRLKKN
ncbi:MAG TPA: tetratricopeptide repeat protein [Candidatus Sulfotelmatobacter sp.]|nr:tetratricopeptide repeat protein [Candidatus Sulfotelmatobacter sp.]